MNSIPDFISIPILSLKDISISNNMSSQLNFGAKRGRISPTSSVSNSSSKKSRTDRMLYLRDIKVDLEFLNDDGSMTEVKTIQMHHLFLQNRLILCNTEDTKTKQDTISLYPKVNDDGWTVIPFYDPKKKLFEEKPVDDCVVHKTAFSKPNTPICVFLEHCGLSIMKRDDNKPQILKPVSHYIHYPQECTAHEASQQSSSSRDHPPSSSERDHPSSSRDHSSSSSAIGHTSSSSARGHSSSSSARGHPSSSSASRDQLSSSSATDNRHMSQVTPHQDSVSNSFTDYSPRLNNSSSSASTSQGGRHYSDSSTRGWGTSSSTRRSSQSVGPCGSSGYNERFNDFMPSTSTYNSPTNNRVGFGFKDVDTSSGYDVKNRSYNVDDDNQNNNNNIVINYYSDLKRIAQQSRKECVVTYSPHKYMLQNISNLSFHRDIHKLVPFYLRGLKHYKNLPLQVAFDPTRQEDLAHFVENDEEVEYNYDEFDQAKSEFHFDFLTPAKMEEAGILNYKCSSACGALRYANPYPKANVTYIIYANTKDLVEKARQIILKCKQPQYNMLNIPQHNLKAFNNFFKKWITNFIRNDRQTHFDSPNHFKESFFDKISSGEIAVTAEVKDVCDRLPQAPLDEFITMVTDYTWRIINGFTITRMCKTANKKISPIDTHWYYRRVSYEEIPRHLYNLYHIHVLKPSNPVWMQDINRLNSFRSMNVQYPGENIILQKNSKYQHPLSQNWVGNQYYEDRRNEYMSRQQAREEEQHNVHGNGVPTQREEREESVYERTTHMVLKNNHLSRDDVEDCDHRRPTLDNYNHDYDDFNVDENREKVWKLVRLHIRECIHEPLFNSKNMRKLTSIILKHTVENWLFDNEELKFGRKDVSDVGRAIFGWGYKKSDIDILIYQKCCSRDSTLNFQIDCKDIFNNMKNFLSWYVLCKLLGTPNKRVSFSQTEREYNFNKIIPHATSLQERIDRQKECDNISVYQNENDNDEQLDDEETCDAQGKHLSARTQFFTVAETRVLCIRSDINKLCRFVKYLHTFYPINYMLLQDNKVEYTCPNMWSKVDHNFLCPCNPKVGNWIKHWKLDTCFRTTDNHDGDGIYCTSRFVTYSNLSEFMNHCLDHQECPLHAASYHYVNYYLMKNQSDLVNEKVSTLDEYDIDVREMFIVKR